MALASANPSLPAVGRRDKIDLLSLRGWVKSGRTVSVPSRNGAQFFHAPQEACMSAVRPSRYQFICSCESRRALRRTTRSLAWPAPFLLRAILAAWLLAVPGARLASAQVISFTASPNNPAPGNNGVQALTGAGSLGFLNTAANQVTTPPSSTMSRSRSILALAWAPWTCSARSSIPAFHSAPTASICSISSAALTPSRRISWPRKHSP